jgi:hypothetical protein
MKMAARSSIEVDNMAGMLMPSRSFVNRFHCAGENFQGSANCIPCTGDPVRQAYVGADVGGTLTKIVFFEPYTFDENEYGQVCSRILTFGS